MKIIVFQKRGASSVLASMIFVSFAICIASSIWICRELTVKSECEAFGRVWTKAILSEYDKPLLEDYGLMAYFGNDSEVSEKLEYYMDYSAAGRLDIDINGINSDLTGYELGDPDNFRDALQKALTAKVISDAIASSGRSERSDKNPSGRIIGNKVVLDTMPSGGMGGTYSIDSVIEKAKALGSPADVKSAIESAGTEVVFMIKYFDNAVTYSNDKDSLFKNEWEYVLKGKSSDDENLDNVKSDLFLMRNALNLASLYKDPKKVELVLEIAETITPGPAGLATQILIAEAWAALETETDMDALMDNKRVPLIKTTAEWKTGIASLLDGDELKEKLDDESKDLLNENRREFEEKFSLLDKAGELKDGLNYDEHLMFMILAMDDKLRLLRIMDIVQINMKYRYYRDFNMMEYYVGTRFSLDVNGKSYEFEDDYK